MKNLLKKVLFVAAIKLVIMIANVLSIVLGQAQYSTVF